jgi:hypothetical protein
MQYMMLIYGPEGGFNDLPQEQLNAMKQEWFVYSQQMGEAGVMVAGDALLPTTAATCVRVRDGKDLITDGPFAETKEALGGYYLMEVPSVDEAIVWAKRCPGAQYGTIELRPVMVFDDAPGRAS